MKKDNAAANDTAVITGGARGIGRAITLALAAKGCDVVINYSGSKEAAEETAKECEALGVRAVTVQGNVASEEDCAKIVETAKKEFGKIDILVNNAGITRDGLLMTMSEEDFQAVLDVNLVGAFRMMKAAARMMIRARYGRIINISSVSGIMGNPGQTNYSASKAGIIGMTKSYAKEVAARGITVNAIAPGFVNTDMTGAMTEKAIETIKAEIPAARAGEPEDIANAAAFLASRDSGYITGQVLCVDGGMCM
jgi:3-oxoacyl-[acyl-carrier protein] reductase